MKNVRRSNRSFNSTPLGDWGDREYRKRFNRAAIKLAERTGMSLPVAQTIADLNGFGSRGRRWSPVKNPVLSGQSDMCLALREQDGGEDEQ